MTTPWTGTGTPTIGAWPAGNYISASDVIWPSGLTSADQAAIIALVEDLIDRVTGCHWYPKPFDLRLNGNNSDRLVLPLCQNILSVSGVWLCGIEVPTCYYSFDHNSVYLNCESGGLGDAEFDYFMRRVAQQGALFPHGLNNVRIVGTYGQAVPAGIKAAAIILCQWKNGAVAYTTTYDSETIGRYSYKLAAGQPILTGCKEADDILRLFKRGKPIMMAP